jgi:nitrogen fixation-related uncharacterized protein
MEDLLIVIYLIVVSVLNPFIITFVFWADRFDGQKQKNIKAKMEVTFLGI